MPKKSGGKSGRPRHHQQPATRPPRAIEVTPITETMKPNPQPVEVPAMPAPPPRPMASTRARPIARSSRAASRIPLITDYAYVTADLKRIALLAAGAFVIIGGLTFVIH